MKKAIVTALVLALLAAFPVDRGRAASRADYMVLPGITVGAIALGTPEVLAFKAIQRYGKVTTDSQGTCAQSEESVICYVLVDGKVAGAAASGPGWYVVTAAGPLELRKASVEDVIAAIGLPDCADGPLGIWDNIRLLLILDNSGIIEVVGITGKPLCGD